MNYSLFFDSYVIHGLSSLHYLVVILAFSRLTLCCMRKKFGTLFISGLREKEENLVLVPDLSVIITSGSLHPDYEARI